MPAFPKVGLDALLTPENCAVLLMDHQPSQLANVNSHDHTLVIDNVTALANTAKAYGVPTILTTINARRGVRFSSRYRRSFPISLGHSRGTGCRLVRLCQARLAGDREPQDADRHGTPSQLKRLCAVNTVLSGLS
jgi:nicotinamidase-related amidase